LPVPNKIIDRFCLYDLHNKVAKFIDCLGFKPSEGHAQRVIVKLSLSPYINSLTAEHKGKHIVDETYFCVQILFKISYFILIIKVIYRSWSYLHFLSGPFSWSLELLFKV
jgi:hypothetical protein